MRENDVRERALGNKRGRGGGAVASRGRQLNSLHDLVPGLLHRLVPGKVQRLLQVVSLHVIRARGFLGGGKVPEGLPFAAVVDARFPLAAPVRDAAELAVRRGLVALGHGGVVAV